MIHLAKINFRNGFLTKHTILYKFNCLYFTRITRIYDLFVSKLKWKNYFLLALYIGIACVGKH